MLFSEKKFPAFLRLEKNVRVKKSGYQAVGRVIFNIVIMPKFYVIFELLVFKILC